MSTRIDGNGAASTASVRTAVDRAAPKEGVSGSKDGGLRRDLVSTFKAAFRLDVTSDVLSEVRDRLVTLRAGLQVATDGDDKKAFVDSTIGSIRRLVDMAELGPVEWPDVPPREHEPGEVLSPLEASLNETVSPELLVPDFTSPTEASRDREGIDGVAATGGGSATAFVDRAIFEIDAARRRVREARGEVGAVAADLVGDRMRGPVSNRGRFVDSELAEAAARAMRDRFASDPEGAVRAMGELDPEAVLSLIS